MRPVNRVAPALPAHARKTYSILAPIETHFRPASCADAGCVAHANGWRTVVDEAIDLGQKQAHYIRTLSGRAFNEERTPEGLTAFTFAAGQKCFKAHAMSLEREPIYVVRDGDHRGNPRGTDPTVYKRPESWVDDFGSHQQRLADRFNQG